MDVATLKAQMASLHEELRTMQETFQSVPVRMTEIASSVSRTAEVLDRHCTDDMLIMTEFKTDIRALSKAVWIATGAVSVLMVLLNLLVPKLLTLWK